MQQIPQTILFEFFARPVLQPVGLCQDSTGLSNHRQFDFAFP